MFGLLFQGVVDRSEFYVSHAEDYVADWEDNIEEAHIY